MFVKNEGIEASKMAEGVERKVLGYGKGLMVVEVRFKKGAVAAPHSHVHEQVSYVVKGSFEFTVNGHKEVMNAGDSVYIPSGEFHQVVALEDSIIADSFSPMREDFIE